MNCPGYNKKLKKIFWMEPRMGPPYNQSQMWINNRGHLSVNSNRKVSLLAAFDPSSQNWVPVHNSNDSPNVYCWVTQSIKILYSFKAIFPDYGVKCHPLGSRKVPYFLPAPKKQWRQGNHPLDKFISTQDERCKLILLTSQHDTHLIGPSQFRGLILSLAYHLKNPALFQVRDSKCECPATTPTCQI